MAGMLDNFYNRRQRGEITLQTLLLLFAGTLLTLTLVVAFVTSYGYFRGYVADQLSAHARDGATATEDFIVWMCHDCCNCFNSTMIYHFSTHMTSYFSKELIKSFKDRFSSYYFYFIIFVTEVNLKI